MENEVTENEVRKTEMIFFKYVCRMDPELIHFLKTCDINVLENAWIYRTDAWLDHKDATNRSVKDWVRRMNSWLRSLVRLEATDPHEANNKPIKVEMADNEYFFYSKKYKSLWKQPKIVEFRVML